MIDIYTEFLKAIIQLFISFGRTMDPNPLFFGLSSPVKPRRVASRSLYIPQNPPGAMAICS